MNTKVKEVTSKQLDSLLNAKDAATLCKLSKRTWFRLCASGKTPEPLRIGGAVRWRSQDIERWLELGCPDRKIFEARKVGHK